jgi:MFS family permease
VEHSAVATHTAPEIRGSAFGLRAGVQSLGTFAASAVAGVICTTLSPSWAFAYLATWMLVAVIALVRNDLA